MTAAAAQLAALPGAQDCKAQLDHTHPSAAAQRQCVLLPEQGGDRGAPTSGTGQTDLFGSIDMASLILATDRGACGSVHAGAAALLSAELPAVHVAQVSQLQRAIQGAQEDGTCCAT